MKRILGLILLSLLVPSVAAEPNVQFQREAGKLHLRVADRPLATYVYDDRDIPRPYFAHVRAPNGTPLTRNHPPVKGQDATDHATFHPGLWLAFGDLGGQDNWRLKARVVHDGFVQEPKGAAGQGSFTVRNRYRTAKDDRTVCTETCHYTVLVRPNAYLLLWDSTFVSDAADFSFGDQEEMGLGVRMATPLAVNRKQGGRILNSEGGKDEKGTWGRAADWCDYSATIDGHHVGVLLMSHPENFRRPWFHTRDYGLMVANPFGRQALTRGERSQVVAKRGEVFRLRFGLLLYSVPATESFDAAARFSEYRKATEGAR
jgi:hypothetical protein